MKTLISTASACSLLLIFSGRLIADNPPSPSMVGGQRIQETGQKAPPGRPVAPPLPAAVSDRISTSSRGLSETRVTTKPGGFKVHLGGRFHSPVVAGAKPAVRQSSGARTSPAGPPRQ